MAPKSLCCLLMLELHTLNIPQTTTIVSKKMSNASNVNYSHLHESVLSCCRASTATIHLTMNHRTPAYTPFRTSDARTVRRSLRLDEPPGKCTTGHGYPSERKEPS